MTRGNFVKQANSMKGRGDGYRVDRDIPLVDLQTASFSGQATLTVSSGVARKTVAASATLVGAFNLRVPGDYDATKDELKIIACAASAGATDAPALLLDVTRYRIGTGAATGAVAITQVASHATASLSAVLTMDLSNNSLLPGDTLTCQLTTEAHTTDAVHVYSVANRYRGVLALYNESER